MKKTVDLSSHINQTIERGHAADFPVVLRPMFVKRGDDSLEPVSRRLAVVRTDTEEPISVVSDRYTLIPHERILDTVCEALCPLDVGPVPSGIFVDRNGARMRAIFKFPALSQMVSGNDEICPCLQVCNTYDTSGRISLQIGAFRFVCTNLAVGGGGVFAGGFVSIHVGEIDIDQVAEQLVRYLQGFEEIVMMYRHWQELNGTSDQFNEIFEPLGHYHAERLLQRLPIHQNVYQSYNAATDYSTHQTRSPRLAFNLLEQINRGFQKAFPLPRCESPKGCVSITSRPPTQNAELVGRIAKD